MGQEEELEDPQADGTRCRRRPINRQWRIDWLALWGRYEDDLSDQLELSCYTLQTAPRQTTLQLASYPFSVPLVVEGLLRLRMILESHLRSVTEDRGNILTNLVAYYMAGRATN